MSSPCAAQHAPAEKPKYFRRRPEKQVLHKLVHTHMNTLFAEAEQMSDSGCGFPSWVKREFEQYLDCAQPQRGFARLKCKSCGHEMLCAFSCKGRSLCPSCVSRRMADTAAYLTDQILPRAPYRLFTLSLPKHIRFKLARDGKLLSRVLSAFIGAVFADYRRRAKKRGFKNPICGSVTFIQRYSSLLRLNIHFHTWFPDGVFTASDAGKLAFHALPPPDTADIDRLIITIRRRILKLCDAPLDVPDDDQLALAWAQQQAIGPLQTQALLSPPPPRPLAAFLRGFSLHADLTVDKRRRGALEKLLRYGARPPFAQKRLSLLDDGRVCLKLRKPYFDGRTQVFFEPVAFLRTLAALVPPPKQNQIRFHGIFSSHHNFRAALKPLVPKPKDAHEKSLLKLPFSKPDEDQDADAVSPQAIPPARRLPWAALLQRVFKHDVLICRKCKGPMRLVKLIQDPKAIAPYLKHLGLPTTLEPPAPARAPPQLEVDDAFASAA